MIHEDDTPRDYEIDDLVQAVLEAEGAKIEAEEEWRKLRAQLAEAVLARGEQSAHGHTDEGEVIRVTVVAPETTKTDEQALAARIGLRAFNRLTKRVLDRDLVGRAIQDGRLSVEDYAACTEIRKTAPYPKLSRVDA